MDETGTLPQDNLCEHRLTACLEQMEELYDKAIFHWNSACRSGGGESGQRAAAARDDPADPKYQTHSAAKI
jgi:hypothetical protein